MLVPINNGRYTKAPVFEAVNDLDGILITETLYFIDASTGEKLNANHVIYGLMGTFYISAD